MGIYLVWLPKEGLVPILLLEIYVVIYLVNTILSYYFMHYISYMVVTVTW
jgi:hypothetical protein